MRLFPAGQAAHQFLHLRHTGRTTDHHDFVQVLSGKPRILECIVERRFAAFQQIGGELLEFGPGQRNGQVLRASAIRRNKGQVDLGLRRRGQLDFRLFRRLAQTLERLAILAQVNALFLLKFISQPVNDALVPVVTTQVCVTIGGLDFDHAIANFQDGHVKRTTT